MKTVLFITVYIAVFTNAQTKDRFRRFIGGQDGSSGQFPYLVSLRYITTDKHFCGGSIIDERFILTATHCLTSKNRKDIYIVAGTNHTKKWRKRYWIDKFSTHTNYDGNKVINDIALIKLKTPIRFSKYIQKIALPSSESEAEVPLGAKMTISGFGRTKQYNDENKKLKYQNVTSISLTQCRKAIRKIVADHYITRNHMCAYDKKKGFCKGDSGGPLVYNGKQVGVVSWMIRPCAIGYPDVYIKVWAYRNWIAKTMQKLNG